MTKSQTAFNDVLKEKSRVTARLIEIRLLPDEKLTDELRAEITTLTQKQGEVEARYIPALDALEAEQSQNGAGGEGAERRALIERADFGNYLGASLHNRALDGAEAELNAALGASPENGGVAIPWPLIAACRAPVERRADAVTSLPTTGNQTVEEEYVSRLFAGGSSEFLMARTVMVPAGSVSIPVIESGPTAEYFANSAVADADAAGVVFKTADPTRLQASVVLRGGDVQRSPGLIPAIQADLAAATADAVDKKKSSLNFFPTYPTQPTHPPSCPMRISSPKFRGPLTAWARIR